MVNWRRFAAKKTEMIYLDNNATTPIAPEVLEEMLPYLKSSYGNPSSAHTAGRQARKGVERARFEVGSMLGAAIPEEVFFTSSGTESDNWAIFGSVQLHPGRDHIVTTTVEHEAVRKACDWLEKRGSRVTRLAVDSEGQIDEAELEDSLTADTGLVSIMHANNETGILFPIERLAAVVKSRSNALFHSDGVNAAGKVPISLKDSAVDLYSISGHKFYAPKGIGALWVRKGVCLPSIFKGGGQERGMRPGTEAVHQIVGLGAAARLASDLSGMLSVQELRDRMENEILKKVPNSRLNGAQDPDKRLPNTSSISFENTNGEAILAGLDDAGICVSTGSACNSNDHTASPVLQAMNVPYRNAMGAIRFSLGRFTTDRDVDVVLEELPGIVERLRRIAGEEF